MTFQLHLTLYFIASPGPFSAAFDGTTVSQDFSYLFAHTPVSFIGVSYAWAGGLS